MALQDSQNIVNSYIQGIQLAMQRKRDAAEQQWRQAESARADSQRDLAKKQFDEEIKQHDISNKAAKAQLDLELALHSRDAAQNLQPDSVDPNGIGTYHLGDRVFTAPTAEQQARIALLDLKNQEQTKSDIQSAARKQEMEQEHQNRLAEIAKTGENQIALGKLDRASAEKIAAAAQSGENFRHNSSLQNDRLIAGINNGLIDPSVLGGMTEHSSGGQIPNAILLKEAALKGDLSSEALDRMGSGLSKYVRNLVTQAGGIVLPQKKLDAINHIGLLTKFGNDAQDFVNKLPDTSSGIVAHVKGLVMPMLDPELSKGFDLLGAQGANIAKGIGGEEGQRLTNFTTKLTGGSYIPDKGLPKTANQMAVDGFKKELQDTIDNETLGGVPKMQADYIRTAKGLGQHSQFMQAPVQTGSAPLTQQTQPQTTVDPLQFFHPVVGGKQ